MRKLATIQRVLAINPIPDADLIERVTIKGWNIVSQKGIHKVGDLVIYIEIDSLLPIRSEFEFLRKTSYRQFKDGSEGFLLRTVRMRGQVSQGLLLPLRTLDSFAKWIQDDIAIGSDVSKMLGIVLYEEPIPEELLGQAKGMTPSFVPDSSQERVQNSLSLIERYAGELYRKTEKLDGWAVSYYINNDTFGVCSKGVDYLDVEGNPYWAFAHSVNLEARLRQILEPGSNVILQGELVGEGIQKNKYQLKGKTVYFYNARGNDGVDAPIELVLDLINNLTEGEKLKECPVINANYILPDSSEKLIEDASIRSLINPKIWAEGVILKNKTISHDFNGRTSIKVINPNFLLKYSE